MYRGWDFKDERITDITKVYDFKQLQFLSVYLFDLVKHFFIDVLLNHKYIVSFHINIDKSINTMLNDPLWLSSEEYYNKIKEKNYSKIINVGKIMLETYPEKLPDKYVPKKSKKNSRKKKKSS